VLEFRDATIGNMKNKRLDSRGNVLQRSSSLVY
jgi:hypothetical protein